MACFYDNDIHVFAGPNWENIKVTIAEKCNPEVVELAAKLEHLPNNPLQAIEAYAQASVSGRFQKYTDTWFDEEAYPKTELMDFG